MNNYYKVLGLDKNATIEQIRAAYKKLAREHHPDKGGDKNEFLKVQEAYDALINKSNVDSTNDSSNINIKTKFFNDNVFFNQAHSTSQKVVKKDIYYDYNIKLSDVYNGTSKKLKLSRKTKCNKCTSYCNNCNGCGFITTNISTGIFNQTHTKQCQKCSGSCYNIIDSNCIECNSTREVVEIKIVDINVPIGVKDKTIYTFNEWGEGANNKNEVSGNFIVVINIEKDPNFLRCNNDLIYTTELTLKESLIGKNVTIPNFSGNIELNTSGFGIINPDVQYTIFNKGLRDSQNNHGHLHLRFKIIYPELSFTPNQLELLKNTLEQVGIS